MTHLEIQMAGLSAYWWRGYWALFEERSYDVDGLTAEQRSACADGYAAAEAEQAAAGGRDR